MRRYASALYQDFAIYLSKQRDLFAGGQVPAPAVRLAEEGGEAPGRAEEDSAIETPIQRPRPRSNWVTGFRG